MEKQTDTDASTDVVGVPMTYDQFLAFHHSKEAERQQHFCPLKLKSKKRCIAETKMRIGLLQVRNGKLTKVRRPTGSVVVQLLSLLQQ